MSAPTSTPIEAAARARRQATVVAAVGAVVPTILAAQGMTSLAVDVLGFPVVAAVALAGFLELALVSSALLARAAAGSCRPRPDCWPGCTSWWPPPRTGRRRGAWTRGRCWPVRCAPSRPWWPPGCGSECYRPPAPSRRSGHWPRSDATGDCSTSPAPPCSSAASTPLAGRPLAVADAHAAGSTEPMSLPCGSRHPRPRSSTRWPPSGQVDHLPAATLVAPLTHHPDTGHEQAGHRLGLVDRAAAAAGDRSASVTEHIDEHTAWPATLFVPGADDELPADDAATTLALAVEVVRADPGVSGARLADELTRRGRPVSTRSGQRWRTRALAALTG